MPKRWIVILDGSSNRGAATKEILTSNAFRMIRPIAFDDQEKAIPQIILYFSGVGTRGDRMSAATGRGFDDIVIEAYVALSSNMQADDTLYVFGFSRGAAAAHILTSMLSDPGLLWADRLELFPLVWKYFNYTGGLGQRRVIRKQIGDGVGYPLVEFLGLFDAVAGQYWDFARFFVKTRFQNMNLAQSVNRAIHILSTNDNRRAFAPLLWTGPSKEGQIIEQIWMPGVHADVGGSSDGTLLGDISLLTMLDRLHTYCPELSLFQEEYIDKELKSGIKKATKVEITNERSDLGRKMLLHQRKVTGKSFNEYLHPVVVKLKGEKIIQRGREAVYQPNNLADLDTVQLGEYGMFISDIVERLIP